MSPLADTGAWRGHDSTSAGGAAEGSQGQALGAPPLAYTNNTTALKGHKEPRKPEVPIH